MSVYIKGMDMPTSCDKCIYSAWSNFYQIYVCNAVRKNEPVLFDGKQTKSTAVARSARADNCPLIPAPDHGRLIDADALVDKHFGKDYLEKAMTANKDEMGTALINIPLLINNAPTIIPADKEGDNADNADAQPVRHGWWIMRGGKWRCSVCDSKALLRLSDATGGCREYEYYRANYCPNCGAKMDGESDG